MINKDLNFITLNKIWKLTKINKQKVEMTS